MHADDAVLADKAPHRIADILLLSALDHFIPHIDICRLLLDKFFVHIENSGEIPRKKVNIHIVL